ncbi:MAG: ISL3 family transposase [Candidatus Competibacteraceae bacterium]|nr:ISL3 family transposase [Candidatus Competibacteraceae bacterium]
MRDTDLMQMALGLVPPWMVTRTAFDPEAKRIDIHIDFPRGTKFACPVCGADGCPAHDTEEMRWRHLNFFQHEAYLHARVPRVRCTKCGVKRIPVPWARDGSGFTLLFEALIMALVTAMPVNAVARHVGEHDTRLWRIIHHYVEEARRRADYSSVTRVAIDETASRRGHDYVTLFVDLDNSRVLFAAEGKDSSTVKAFADDLVQHRGDPNAVNEVCIDMSQGFISGTTEYLPNAQITFDKFHAVQLVNEAVDLVRRAEQKERGDLLTKTRYIWLKNPGNLTTKQRAKLESLSRYNLKTARAYQIRLTFQELFNQPTKNDAETFLKKWYFWATHSRLEPIKQVARTIKRHWDGILRWFDSQIANGLIEGINSLVQAAKAKARGYRTNRNLCAIIYLIAGKLDIRLPT